MCQRLMAHLRQMLLVEPMVDSCVRNRHLCSDGPRRSRLRRLLLLRLWEV